MQTKLLQPILTRSAPTGPIAGANGASADGAIEAGRRGQRKGGVVLEEQPAPAVPTARRKPQPTLEPELVGEIPPSPRCRWNADYL